MAELTDVSDGNGEKRTDLWLGLVSLLPLELGLSLSGDFLTYIVKALLVLLADKNFALWGSGLHQE